MKKISFALLASSFAVGAASAQTPGSGIVTTHNANVVAQIEQHAQDVQAQSRVDQQEAPGVRASAHHRYLHHHLLQSR